MSDESGRYTAEHTVMDKDLEIRELKHLLEVKDNRIKELEEINESHQKLNGELRQEIVQLKSPDYPKSEVDYTINAGSTADVIGIDESEDEFTEQLSFKFNQE